MHRLNVTYTYIHYHNTDWECARTRSNERASGSNINIITNAKYAQQNAYALWIFNAINFCYYDASQRRFHQTLFMVIRYFVFACFHQMAFQTIWQYMNNTNILIYDHIWAICRLWNDNNIIKWAINMSVFQMLWMFA